jgi:hypothetical protein
MLIRWFKNLPAHRKVLLFLAGGMVTLVFDAFVAHFKWARHSMNWNQWIPVVYGLIAAVVLAVPALIQLEPKVESKVLVFFGLVGIVVGTLGVYFHLSRVIGNLPEEHTVEAIGRELKDEPPIFAPAAFAGVGLLLLVLKRITGAHRNG